MKSFCIKDNNIKSINYLLVKLSNIDSKDFIFVEKDFSKFKNIIIHYTGNNLLVYLDTITNLIYDCILNIYEPKIIKYILSSEYFYFDLSDLKIIEKNCLKALGPEPKEDIVLSDSNFSKRKILLWDSVLDYIKSNKSILLDGFIRFRINDYKKCLDESLTYAVNQFVIDKEYNDFINLIKLYIETRPPNSDTIYLNYNNGSSILLDENNNIINCEKYIMNANYLSDISFSSNDYTLNSLLSLLPSKLIINLNSPEDEFITTLKLIFPDRVFINPKHGTI